MNSLVMIFIAFSEMIVEMRGGALVDELGDDLHQPFSRLKYTILFHQFHGEITILHFCLMVEPPCVYFCSPLFHLSSW